MRFLFTLQPTPSPSSFTLLGFCMMVDIHLFLLLYNNEFANSNIVTMLVIWKIIVFYLHPYNNYVQHSHSSNKCFKNKTPTRKNIYLGWIAY